MVEEGEKSFMDKLKEDRGALALALLALLLIIFGVFAVLGGAGVVTMSPPTNLQATVIYPNVKLTWDHSVDYPDPCMGYNAYWSTTAGQLGVLQNAEPVADNKYTIKNVKPGTYYATVRCVDNAGNEDGNLNQLEVKVEVQPPSGLSVIINDGAEYTNKKDVTLALSARNAEECAYANENLAWSAWGVYTIEKAWTLTENAGGCEEKTVYYKCRNAGGESSPVSDTIILDTLPPSVSFNVLSIQDNKIALQIFVQDDCVPNVDCYVFAGDQQIDSIQNLAGQAEKTYEVPYGKYFLSVACTDDARNTGSAALEVNVKQPENATNKTEVSIKINNDAATTTSLDVTLNLYCRINGETPDEVYYSSAEMGQVGPERYTTSRTWKLDTEVPEHSRTYTVCYRCEKDDVTARACDSIRFVVEGEEGDGDGDGDGDGNVPPRNLRAEIIGYRTPIGTGWHLPTLIPDTEVTKGNKDGVYLSLSSSGATECKVWNEKIEGVDTGNDEESDVEWSTDLVNNPSAPWELIPYMVVQPGNPDDPFNPLPPITIVGDGNRTINYKCQNPTGATGPIKDSIWYDATPPASVADLSGEYRPQLGEGDVGLPMLNIKLRWEPAVDNSWNWYGYTHKGIQLYSVCRYYNLAEDLAKAKHDLGCEDYTPAYLGCEEDGHFALECAFIDLELPSDLTTQGGEMCYNVSAWDYVGWQSNAESVCVDVPPSGPINKLPEIEWVAIYTILPPGDDEEEVETQEQYTQEQKTIIGSSGISTVGTQSPINLVLFAQPGYGGNGEAKPPPVPSGDMYTRRAAVLVKIKATNAEQCKMRNNGVQKTPWSDWMDYANNPETYQWTLLDMPGKRIVEVQCKNQFGSSAIKSDSIIYDPDPPDILQTSFPAWYEEACDKNWIRLEWGKIFKDPISGLKSYVVEEYTKQLSGGGGGMGPQAYDWVKTHTWEITDPSITTLYDYEFVKSVTYKYKVIACDKAGNCNVGVNTTEVTPTKNPYNSPCE